MRQNRAFTYNIRTSSVLKNIKTKDMKILLATDGSAHSKAAVEEVARRPFPPRTRVRIISVIDRTALTRNMGPLGGLSEYYAEVDRNALKLAEDAIENAAKVLRKKNTMLSVTTAAIEGFPKSAIIEEAEKYGADLIVVGSHGYGAVKRFLLGSVSHAVSLHAKCSVEIVRIPNRKPIKRKRK